MFFNCIKHVRSPGVSDAVSSPTAILIKISSQAFFAASRTLTSNCRKELSQKVWRILSPSMRNGKTSSAGCRFELRLALLEDLVSRRFVKGHIVHGMPEPGKRIVHLAPCPALVAERTMLFDTVPGIIGQLSGKIHLRW